MARALGRRSGCRLAPGLAVCLWLWAACVACAALVHGRGGAFRLPEHARIFGGVNASAHEFPTQVYIVSLLQAEHEPPVGLFCGGTILNEKWILTAAHCIKNSIRTAFGYGTANKQRLEYQEAARVIPHAEYVLFGRNENNADNDVGLVEASERLPLDGRAVAAARLPDPMQPIPHGRAVVVAGWGRWTYDALQAHPGSTAVLKKLDVHLIPCPGDNMSHVICIQTDTGTGICDGDSGGPLMVNGVVYGVASYVDNINNDPSLDPNLHCNEGGSWAVYMSVQAYRPWIYQHTGI